MKTAGVLLMVAVIVWTGWAWGAGFVIAIVCIAGVAGVGGLFVVWLGNGGYEKLSEPVVLVEARRKAALSNGAATSIGEGRAQGWVKLSRINEVERLAGEAAARASGSPQASGRSWPTRLH